MRKWMLLPTLVSLISLVPLAQAQHFDVAFGISGIRSTSGANAGADYSPQDVGGGVYPGFSADVLLFHNLGVEGELSWRASQNTYNADLSGQPFRPIFWAINGIYSKTVAHRVGFEVLGGIGEESVRFYQPYYNNCSFTGCTNYTSVGHLMGDLGAGLRLYVKGGLFVRPEARLYLIHNNVEFSSGHAERLGVSIGYTFGEQ